LAKRFCLSALSRIEISIVGAFNSRKSAWVNPELFKERFGKVKDFTFIK